MSSRALPERASLEYLKKLAKDQLRELRASDPNAKLSSAQLTVARDHGFASWRALKSEVERRHVPTLDAFFAACREGDIDRLKALLEAEPALAREGDIHGSTGLHAAVAHPACVRLLLAHGADPNARDRGDNAYALHFAAAGGHLESTGALLDAGADVHGFGDAHLGDVIGWAASGDSPSTPEIVALLLERGARHHVFSAISTGDPDLVRRLVEADPGALERRRSRFEQGQTSLHFTLAAPDGLSSKAPQYEIAELLIELGADLEAKDDLGRTALEIAMLRGDLRAMRLLRAAGAKQPALREPPGDERRLEAVRAAMLHVTPMLCVEDVGATVAWYTSLGFEVRERQPPVGDPDWALLVCGKASFMVQSLVKRPANQVALWFYTERIEEVYDLLKGRQLGAAGAALAGDEAPSSSAGIEFEQDLHQPFYGGRQFGVLDAAGFEVVFYSP